MKKILSICLIFLSVLSACTKKDDPHAVYPMDRIQKDSIVYHKFATPVTIASMTGTIVNQDIESCGDYPVPADSTVKFRLSCISGDTTHDIILIAEHFPTPAGSQGSCSAHCPHVTYLILVQPSHAQDAINWYQGCPVMYDTTMTVSGTGQWLNTVALGNYNEGCSNMFTCTIPNTYIGFKDKNCLGWIHIQMAANNGVTIFDYAINLTPGNSIRAGQTH